jgi:sulfite oxidase
LEVAGLVEKPLRLSLRDLKGGFAATRIEAALQCAGNRRTDLYAVAAIPRELAWGPEAVSNAVWGGVRLRDVLREAGVRGSARHVHFAGLDRASVDGAQAPFGASVPIRKALSPETLLAFEMNGRPLAPVHGSPVRVVVPGYIGARSVKWLKRIEVAARPSSNPFQARAYKRLAVGATPLEERRARPLMEAPLNCAICLPADGARLQGPRVRVRGYALVGRGTRVDRVEVSADGGKRWVRARIEGHSSAWAWCLWEAQVAVGPGPVVLVARAQDLDGRSQPRSLRAVWNAKGYANNAWHRISITVAP